MKANIIKKSDSILGINNAFPKNNPNTQAPVNNQIVSIEDATGPAMLAGLYKKTRSEAGANDLITKNGNSVFEIIFGNQKDNVAKNVAIYALSNEADAYTEMQHVADVTREYVLGNLKIPGCYIFNEFLYDATHQYTYTFTSRFENGRIAKRFHS